MSGGSHARMPHSRGVWARSLPRALAVLVLLAPVLLGAGAAVASTGEAAWGARPDDTERGDGRANFRYVAAPGETLADALLVTNRGTEPLELRVEGADAEITPDGLVELSDHPPVGLGSWLELSTELVQIGPGESVRVPFSLSVPLGASGVVAGAVVTASFVEGETVALDRRLAVSIVLEVDREEPAVGTSGVPPWMVVALAGLAAAAGLTWLGVLRARARD